MARVEPFIALVLLQVVGHYSAQGRGADFIKRLDYNSIRNFRRYHLEHATETCKKVTTGAIRAFVKDHVRTERLAAIRRCRH
jgi:hypothetical protein